MCVCCCVFDQLWFPENCVQCGWEQGKGDYTKKGIKEYKEGKMRDSGEKL